MKITKRQLRRIIREELNRGALDEGLWDDIGAQLSKAVQLGKMTASQAKKDFASMKKMGSKGAEAAMAAKGGGDLKDVLEPFLPEIRQKLVDYISFDGAKMAAAEVNPSEMIPQALQGRSGDLTEWVNTFEANLKKEVQSTVARMSNDIADAVIANLTPK